MSKTKRNTVLAGAIAMAFAGGAALAGGPVGSMPFDGDGNNTGAFTIDNALFDAADVDAAPCPTGSVCTNMTATTDNEILMREVDNGSARFIQTIIVDPDAGQGDFVYETSVYSQGSGNENDMGAKLRIDDAGNSFFTEQAIFRGAQFGADAANNSINVTAFQEIAGFQTFDMESDDTPNQGGSTLPSGRIQILQEGGGGMQEFGHTILAGTFQTSAGTLTAGAESVTFVAGNTVTATWIGGGMAGGGPGVILDPGGQTQNHDTRTAAQRDFGMLIYRAGNTATSGNAGGTPNGIVEPQFTSTSTLQARAFSGPDPLLQDSGLMYNLDHGSFVGGADILANDWDDTVFGANPY